jgi:cytochrome c
MINLSPLLGLLFLGLSFSTLLNTAISAQAKRGDLKSSPVAAGLGKADFDNNCAACHPTASGQNGYGPGLLGVVGRRAGTARGYAYSPSYVEAGSKGVVWTEANLLQFLADPASFLAQRTGHPAITRMIGGFPNEGLRKSVIGYLKSLK